MPVRNLVYGLIDPKTMELRYVGITVKTPQDRLKEHLLNAFEYNSQYHVHRWIRKLSTTPAIIILERNPSDLFEAEKRWIAYLKAKGARLTNMTNGGDGTAGYVFDDKTKALMSQKALERWDRPGEREKLSEFTKKRTWSSKVKAKISASLIGNARTKGHKYPPEVYDSRRGPRVKKGTV